MTPLEAFEELGIPHFTGGKHCRPGWAQFHCPNCGDGVRPGLGYNLTSGVMNCWSCGPLRSWETLAQLSGKTVAHVASLLGRVERVHVPENEKIRGKLVLPKGVGPLGFNHKQYIKSRGLDWKEVARLWGVEGIPIPYPLGPRLFIPVHFHGKVVSWTTRHIVPNSRLPRYISAAADEESIPHKDLLYGEDYARHTIIIHEGPLDVWTTGPGAVGTLGVSYTQAQLLRMVRFPRRVVCFDNEPRAQKRAEELCRALEVFPGETFNAFYSGKDANDTERGEIKEMREKFLET